jgi:hypothetical protein
MNRDDISRDERRCRYTGQPRGAKAEGFIRRVFLECLASVLPSCETHINSLFSIGLLDNSDSSVGDEDEQNDRRLDKRSHPGSTWLGCIFKQGENKGDDGRAKKDEDELVFELGEDEGEQRGRGSLRKSCTGSA